MKPRGGTEIQFDELKKRLPEKFWDRVTITTSVPEKTPIDPTKLNRERGRKNIGFILMFLLIVVLLLKMPFLTSNGYRELITKQIKF
jgi:hypothetical protein